MADFIERRVGALTVRIDRHLCVGFGDCITAASGLFLLDDEGVAAFREPPMAAREAVLDACRACPVDALTVLDESGATLVP